MALSFRTGTPVRDPVALATFTAALNPTGAPEPSTGPSRAPSLPPGVVAGVITLAIAVATITVPVAVATTSTKPRCAPVAYALDARVGPPGAAQIVHDVFKEVEMMSGIRFVAARDHRRAGAPVRIAWAERGANLEWDRDQLASATATWSQGDRGATVVFGDVVFRHPVDAGDINAAPVDWHTLVRHEVGHLMGLAHQSDPSDVMYPRLSNRQQTWTSTDRAQLGARGRAAGCDALAEDPAAA